MPTVNPDEPRIQIMKLSAALTLTIALSSIAVPAQGVLNFGNFGNGVDAPVIAFDGTNRLSGPAFGADLWWAPGVVTNYWELSALGQSADFDTNGYFFGGIRTIPNAGPGATITCQVRVWDYAHGNSWLQAQTTFGATIGQSSLFQVVLGDSANAASSLTGLMPFQTYPSGLDNPLSRPDPVPLAVTQIADGVVFTWPAWKGWYGTRASFALQQKSDPSDTTWVTLTNTPQLTVSETTIFYQVVAARPSGAMFYRLVSTHL